MAVMVLGLFFLYMQVWDIFMAGAKLITGWMCTAILSFTTVYQVREEEIGITPKRVFKAMSLIMAWMIAYIISSRINDYLGSWKSRLHVLP